MANSNEQTLVTSSRVPLIVGICIFALLFGGVGGWFYFANLSGAVVAQGIVAVSGKPKTIQHLDGGIVSAILVSDGSLVKKGDLLISLDEKLLAINLEINSSKLREYTAQHARLVAERDNSKTVIWNDKLLKLLGVSEDASIKNGQENFFIARKKTRMGQIAQLEEKIAQYESRIIGIAAQTKTISAQIEFMQVELAGLRTLKLKGLVSNTRLLGLERQGEELLGQKAAADSELASFRNLINETRMQMLQVELEFRQSVLKELGEVDQKISDVVQQIYVFLEKLKRVHIRAPVSGLVHELKVFTIGGVITPGDPIMQIIPRNDTYEIEVKIEPQFIDELMTGEVATLRFTSFNQKTTPELLGSIKTISANSIENLQTGMAFYKVNIEIPPDQITRLNGKVLVPGMPVEAFIKTRERTALNYLMKPLLDQVRHAFREK